MDFTEMFDENGNPIIYTITLSDGTKLENLTLNGNNFVSKEVRIKEEFEDNLSPVTISDGVQQYTYENMELVHLQKYGEDYYFILRKIPKDVLEKMKIRSDMEYLAMMTGVDLEA